MEQKNYKHHNAQAVLNEVENAIEAGWSIPIMRCYDRFSIFDWWPERLTVAHMKQMRTFLNEAIKLGYTGYVCFKVGASGCANGMWAYKKESTDGYSPKGVAIYRSFTPDYTYYGFCDDEEVWYPASDKYDSLKTTKMLEEAMKGAALL